MERIRDGSYRLVKGTGLAHPLAARAARGTVVIPGGERVYPLPPFGQDLQDRDNKAAISAFQALIGLETAGFSAEASLKAARMCAKHPERKAYSNGANKAVDWQYPDKEDPVFSYDRPRYRFTAEYCRDPIPPQDRLARLLRNFSSGGPQPANTLPEIDLKALRMTIFFPGSWSHQRYLPRVDFEFREGNLWEVEFTANYPDLADPARLLQITDSNLLVLKLREFMGEQQYDDTNTGFVSVGLFVGSPPFLPQFHLHQADQTRTLVPNPKISRFEEHFETKAESAVSCSYEPLPQPGEFIQGREEHRTYTQPPYTLEGDEFRELIVESTYLIPQPPSHTDNQLD